MIGTSRGSERDKLAQGLEAHDAEKQDGQRGAEKRDRQQRADNPPGADAAVEGRDRRRVESQMGLALHELSDDRCRGEQRHYHSG